MFEGWEYDERSFEYAARVILKINPHVKKAAQNEADLVRWMKAQTVYMVDTWRPLPELLNQKLTHWGTYGFEVAISPRKNGTYYAQASLAPYIVAEALGLVD